MFDWIWILVPLAGISLGGLAIYLDYKKKMKMIEHGIKPEEKEDKEDRITGGLVMLGIGSAFMINGMIVWKDLFEAYALIGLVCSFIGIALVLSNQIEKN